MRIFQLQRISAVALLVFMTIHMTFLHYDVQAAHGARFAPYEIEFSTVIDRLQTPLWQGIDIAFLFFVLVHALTGAYMVITDLDRFTPYKKILMGAAVLIFIVAMYYGSATILAFGKAIP